MSLDRTKEKQTGFTLIELLGVLTVMAILMAMTVPSFIGITRRARIDSALNNLKSNLLLARQQAVVKQVPVYVVFPTYSQDNEKGYRAYAVFSGESDVNNRERISSWKFLPEGIYFDSDPVRTSAVNIFDLSSTLSQEAFPPELSANYYAYVKFRPDGTVYTSGKKMAYPRIHLLEGRMAGGQIIPKDAELVNNMVTTNAMRINHLTGICRIIQDGDE